MTDNRRNIKVDPDTFALLKAEKEGMKWDRFQREMLAAWRVCSADDYLAEFERLDE